MSLPTPERVAAGRRCWYVWLTKRPRPGEQRPIILRMVAPMNASEAARDAEIVRVDPPVDPRLDKLADAITSVCGWLPLSVRYRAASHALDVVKAWQQEDRTDD